MGQTFHDIVKAALIRESMRDGSLDLASFMSNSFLTPEKYQRMWKKITGKTITLEEAKAKIEP